MSRTTDHNDKQQKRNSGTPTIGSNLSITSVANGGQEADLGFSSEIKRSLLQALISTEKQIPSNLAPESAAAWLRNHALGGLGALRLQSRLPAVASLLQTEYFLITAENAIHQALLEKSVTALSQRSIVPTLIKGVSLIQTVYQHEPAARTMSDIDLWIERKRMSEAVRVLQDAGFTVNQEKEARPRALQELSDGEVQIVLDGHPNNLIELQYAPVSGWWQKRTARLDFSAMWLRSTPITLTGGTVRVLSAEDTIIQFAVHTVAQHQLSLYALRAFVDAAHVIQEQEISWQLLIARVHDWRVRNVTWLFLYLAHANLNIDIPQSVLDGLAPAKWRQQLLLRFVSADDVLDTVHLDKGKQRFLFLLAIADRVTDAATLFVRTLWPEPEWLAARYGHENHWRHLLKTIQTRKV